MGCVCVYVLSLITILRMLQGKFGKKRNVNEPSVTT